MDNRQFFVDLLNLVEKHFKEEGHEYVEAIRALSKVSSRYSMELRGISISDLSDCYTLACYEASGIESKKYPPSISAINFGDVDPYLLLQYLVRNIERLLGVYPVVSLKTEAGIAKDFIEYGIG